MADARTAIANPLIGTGDILSRDVRWDQVLSSAVAHCSTPGCHYAAIGYRTEGKIDDYPYTHYTWFCRAHEPTDVNYG